MSLVSRKRVLVGALALALTMLVPALPVFAAKPGNTANAKACYKGGWQDLRTSDQQPFANQDACISYAAHGGTLTQPAATPRVWLTYGPWSPGYCLITMHVENVTPSSTLAGIIQRLGYNDGVTIYINTDANGDGAINLSYYNGGWSFDYTVDGVSSGYSLMAC